MNPKRITKLYEHLTGTERGQLAFQYFSEGDVDECQRLHETAPFLQYRCIDLDYYETRQACLMMAHIWGMEHWYYRYYRLHATFRTVVNFTRKQYQDADQAIEEVRFWESQLLALDAALERVCSEQGLKSASVRTIANTEPYQPVLPDVVPDANCEKNQYTVLSALFAGVDGNSR